jgi:hypothetical protein
MSDLIWESQRHLAILGCYTATIDGLDGAQTQEAIRRAIARHCGGEEHGWLDVVKQKVRDMQPSNPRMGKAALFADIDRICDILTLTMDEQKAYIAATIWKETAYTMQPVEEAFNLSPAARHKYLTSKAYYPHYGMGDIQFTWLNNYKWVTTLFTPASAYIDGKIPDSYPTNFVANPRTMLNPEVSLLAAIVGMYIGVFRRNHSLKRYINEGGVDFYGARNIVNGVVPSVANEIGAKAEEFTDEFRRMRHG